MINYIIPLVSSFSPMWSYVLNLMISLFFVATVPCIVRGLIYVRSN